MTLTSSPSPTHGTNKIRPPSLAHTPDLGDEAVPLLQLPLRFQLQLLLVQFALESVAGLELLQLRLVAGLELVELQRIQLALGLQLPLKLGHLASRARLGVASWLASWPIKELN